MLGRTITRVLRTPGRLVQSIADSTFDAWIKFCRPDENSPNAGVSYYEKGALVALALDLSIRRYGRGSLDTGMRLLWERHGRSRVGVPEDGFQRIVEALAGAVTGDFFDRYVYGTEDPPLGALFDAFGIDLHLRAGNGAEDRGGEPATEPARACSLGAKIGNDLRLLHVFSGSPAEHAGLAANDVLVAIDGIRASASAIESLLRRGVAEMSVSVHAFRRDELIELDLVLAHAPLDTCYLTLRPDAPDACVGLRNAWLTGHVSAFLRFAAPSSDCRWSGTTL